MRRTVLKAAAATGMGLLGAALLPARRAQAADEYAQLATRLTGKTPAYSERVHLVMPTIFPNGYTVPLMVEVDSPMTESDYVRQLHVLAPRNPLLKVVTFRFTPRRSQARVSTRIRLAAPQYVLAVAELSNGSVLMNRTWVKVSINGCA
jgi:sulfur-oxidizing protein SoxY